MVTTKCIDQIHILALILLYSADVCNNAPTKAMKKEKPATVISAETKIDL